MFCRSGTLTFIFLMFLFLPVHAGKYTRRGPQRGMPAAAQSRIAAVRNDLGRLRAQLDSLRSGVDSVISKLEQRIENLEKKDELQEPEELIQEAERFVQKEKKEEKLSIGKKFRSGTRQLQALNPNISVTGDLLGSLSTSNNPLITTPSEFSDGRDRFFLREVELDIVAPLDPFTRGKFFIGIERGEI
ncbi:MAG: hypothetical protein DRG82_16875, partial [Deltaproteobacteria bacterium]